MQHDPHAVFGIQAELDEVVAAAECAELGPGLLGQLLHGTMTVGKFFPPHPSFGLLARQMMLRRSQGASARDVLSDPFHAPFKAGRVRLSSVARLDTLFRLERESESEGLHARQKTAPHQNEGQRY